MFGLGQPLANNQLRASEVMVLTAGFVTLRSRMLAAKTEGKDTVHANAKHLTELLVQAR